MPISAQRTFGGQKLEALEPNRARVKSVALKPNTLYPKGTVMGYVTSANVNEVQTLDFGGTVSGGTFTLSITGVDGLTYTTAALAYNITNAALKTAIEALLETAGYDGATVTIGGGAAPTDATVTFGGSLANRDVPLMTAEDAALTGTAPTLAVVATTAGVTTGVWGAYVDGNSDGTQVAKGIMMYTVRSDNNGKVTYGDSVQGDEVGVKYDGAPVYVAGQFDISQLVGLDAAGVTDLGKLESGTVASGQGTLVVYGA